jgi:hypothetical protein
MESCAEGEWESAAFYAVTPGTPAAMILFPRLQNLNCGCNENRIFTKGLPIQKNPVLIQS